MDLALRGRREKEIARLRALTAEQKEKCFLRQKVMDRVRCVAESQWLPFDAGSERSG